MSTLDFAVTVLVSSIGLCSVLLLLAICVVSARGDREEERDAREVLAGLSDLRGCERRGHGHGHHVGARR